MMQFGFSYVGLGFLLMLFIPNMIWTKHKPRDYEKYVGNENRILSLLLYEGYWIRYFRSRQEMTDFYSSFLGIPVAGASLPVAAFFLLGIYGRNPLMLLAVTVLGIGHIGIHLAHRREVSERKR